VGTVFRRKSKRSSTGWRYYVSLTFQGQQYKEVVSDTRGPAVTRLRELENRLDRIGDAREKKIPFDFLCDEYLGWGEVNLKARTLSERKIAVRAHLKPFFFSTLAGDLDERAVENYKAARTAAGIAPSTLNTELKYLSCILKYGVKMKYLEGMPEILRVSVPKKKKRFFTPEQLFEALGKIQRVKTRAMVQLALFTGIRKSEMAFLEWSDVDFERKLLHIQPKEKWEGKTDGAHRTIPLNAPAEAALRMAKELDDRRPKKSTLVFPGKGGRPMRDGMRFGLRTACEAAGLDRVHVHGLRHTFGTMLAQQGADPFAIMRALGHSDIKTSLIYVQTAKSHLEEQVGRLDGIAVPEARQPKSIPNGKKTKKGEPGKEPDSP
jgi:integrase